MKAILIEQGPLVAIYSDEPGGDDYEWASHVNQLPREWINVLWPLTEVDIANCVDCKQAIGYLLDDDDDSPKRGWAHWMTMGLVQGDDGKIFPVCEDCFDLHTDDTLETP